MKKKFLLIIKTFLTILAFTLNLTNSKDIININNPLKVSVIFIIITSIFFYLYYQKYQKLNLKEPLLFKLLASIYSIFMLIGNSYKAVGNYSLILENYKVFLISILMFLGYYFLFSSLITFIYEELKKKKFKKKDHKLIDFIFNKHPFLATFCLLFLLYLPYLIAYYPGIISPDPSFQIEQFLGIKTKYSDYNIMLDENVTITNHHPVLHTLIIGSFAKLGIKIGSFNLGIFFYTLMQTIALISLFSYIIWYYKKINTPLTIRIITLLIYGLVPVFPFYAVSTVKDVFFTIFVILYIIRLFDLIKFQNFNWQNLIILTILMLLISLFRNNGIYLVIMSFPFLFVAFPKKILKLLVTFLIPIISYYSFTNILLPYWKITPGSIREILSIPFQQTARYVKYHNADVTDEEKIIIDKILEYDTLATRYKPNIADPVKNKYNKYSTNEDLNNYFQVWWNQFQKHPGTYINATFANTYGYIYPDTHSWYIYNKFYPYLNDVGIPYHYNNLDTWRNILYYYGSAFPYIPVIGLLVNIGFATWLWMLIFTYIIKLKKYKYLIIICPVISLILVCFASPVNTYFRYTLGFVFSIPLIMAIFINLLKE